MSMYVRGIMARNATMLVAIVFGVFAAAALCSAGPAITIQECLPSNSKWQQWQQGPDSELVLMSNGMCLEVVDASVADESEIWTNTCHPNDTNPKHFNQAWRYNSTTGNLIELMSGSCADRAQYGTTAGTKVWLYHCTGVDNQVWFFNRTDATIRANDSGLCLDAGSPKPVPCNHDPLRDTPFCNTSLPFRTRAADIVQRLTPAEKYSLLGNDAAGIVRLNLPAYEWWSEALHGVGNSPGVEFSGNASCATSFPQVIHTAASFNKTLYAQIGSAISTEARAMSNVNQAGNTFWTPNVNIVRDPRWGRGQETPGEDPYANGVYAQLFVPGLQEGEDGRYLKASSCCKHFFDYNLENWHGMDRFHYDANATDQDIADTYLPPFEACVRHGRVSGLMCSYNSVNGIPSCANKDLLTTIARESWGFEGYITSDDGAVEFIISAHHYTQTNEQTVQVVLDAGVDIDCGTFLGAYAPSALAKGLISNATVDQALVNLFTVQLRLGLFDPFAQQPYRNYSTDLINTPQHQQLALEASQQGMTLLKNEDSKLPLSKTTQTVALIGPNANASVTMQGNYQGIAPFLITPTQGFSSYIRNVVYEQGCNVACTSYDSSAVTSTAEKADEVVVVVGLDQTQEREGHDRTSISLPGKQEDLIQTAIAAASKPITLVVMTGSSLDVSTFKANPKVGAIMWCGYPGQAGGQALADAIFGTVNPSGRLPYTVYPASYASQVSMLDNGMRPNLETGNPGRTYRFYTGTPVFEYGSGLSYTKFAYTTSQQSEGLTVQYQHVVDYVRYAQQQHKYTRINSKQVASMSITVKNVGDVAGADVVQAFIKAPTPGVPGAALKELIGFERVFLSPGESKTIEFPLTAHDLTAVDRSGVRRAVLGVWTVFFRYDAIVSVPVHVIS
eukprot:m.113052 g.113052  ORF g.113052 m.113052 type:complete len:901 (+) comp13502_c0_seq1:214-2916(+)